MISQDLSAKYEDNDEAEEVEPTEEVVEPIEEVEVTDDIPDTEEAPEEEASPVEEVAIDYPHFNTQLGYYKEVTQAQHALVANGHHDQPKIAFISNEWRVVSGTDIAEIAAVTGHHVEYKRIGRMKRDEAETYYFRYLLANGNMTRTQLSLLAAKYITLGIDKAVDVIEEYPDQLTNMNVSNALGILHTDPAVFYAMLQTGKIKLGTSPTSSLKAVKTYVEHTAAKRKKEKAALEAAAKDFISIQAGKGVPQEDLAKVLQDIANSLKA